MKTRPSTRMPGLFLALASMTGTAIAEDAMLAPRGAASPPEQTSRISDSVSNPSSDTPKMTGIDREFRKDNKTLQSD